MTEENLTVLRNLIAPDSCVYNKYGMLVLFESVDGFLQ